MIFDIVEFFYYFYLHRWYLMVVYIYKVGQRVLLLLIESVSQVGVLFGFGVGMLFLNKMK